MDKFLSTSTGSVNLSDGSVDIYANTIRSDNLTGNMTLKTDGEKKLISESLTTADISNIIDLNTKEYLQLVKGVGFSPDIGNIALYAKLGEGRLFTRDDNLDEHEVGDVFTTLNSSQNHSLAVFQGSGGKHLTDSNLIYNSNTSALENVGILQNGTSEILLSQTGDITLAASNIYSNGNLQMGNNNIKFVDGTNTSSIEPSAYLEIKDETRIKLSKYTGGANFYEFPLILSPTDPAIFRNYAEFEYQTLFNSSVLAESYLEVRGTAGSLGNLNQQQLFLRHPNSTTSGWWLGAQWHTPSTSDNDFYFQVVYSDGGTHIPGFIQDGVNTNPPTQMNFTAQHRTYTELKYNDDMIGKLMIATGEYRNMLKIDAEVSTQASIKINDAHPIVELCDEIGSKRVFGVCAGLEEEKRNFNSGLCVALYEKDISDNRIFCNGGGEGAILVIDGQVYENGDLLQSYHCYASKQSDDIIRSSSVAKITCDLDFDSIPMEDVKIFKGADSNSQPIFENVLNPDGSVKQQPKYSVRTIELNGETRRVALVGCVYMMS